MEITKKIEDLEKEILELKSLILLKGDEIFEKKFVSLRGMGKLLVSEDELGKAIEEAKKSLFTGAEDVIRS